MLMRLSRYWVKLWPTVLCAGRFWWGVPHHWKYLWPLGAVPQTLTLFGDISGELNHFRVKPPTEFNNCVYSIPCSFGKIYKSETGRPLFNLTSYHCLPMFFYPYKSKGMADHIWKEKRNHLPLWDKVEKIDRAEHWRIRRLKESAHMVGCNDRLSWPSIERNPSLVPDTVLFEAVKDHWTQKGYEGPNTSIEMNTIWEPIIKKVR